MEGYSVIFRHIPPILGSKMTEKHEESRQEGIFVRPTLEGPVCPQMADAEHVENGRPG